MTEKDNCQKEFRLVIPVRLADWLGGWAAGSIPAHFIHCKREGKVFWYQPLVRKGFGSHGEYVCENWDRLRKNPGKHEDGLPFISDIGYFYECGTDNVTWQFKLEGIFKQADLSEEQKRFIPSFREVYLNGTHEWILLSNMKQLKIPKRLIRSSDFAFLSPQGITPVEYSHIRVNCFVAGFPDLTDEELTDPNPNEILDLYLKQFLWEGQKDKFRERNVQAALLNQLLSEGVIFAREGILKIDENTRGRYDFLVRKKDEFLAFELKVEDDTNAPQQLQDYITAIMREHDLPREKIKGYIICGNPSDETRRKARDLNFGVLEYTLRLQFPDLKDIL
jgi:hypothetical protein